MRWKIKSAALLGICDQMPSKEAKEARRIAKKCKALATDIRQYSPSLAEALMYTAKALTATAAGLDTFVEDIKPKRHSQHPETKAKWGK